MSVRSASYLSLLLALTLTGACGAEGPSGGEDALDEDESDQSSDESGDSDDTSSEDGTSDDDDAPPDDDDDSPPTGNKDAGKPPADAGKDAGGPAPGTDGGGASPDGGGATPDAGRGGDAGGGRSDAGRPARDSGMSGGPTPPPTGDTNIPQHGDPPSEPSARGGPYRVDSFEGDTGRIYYPTDAEGPFAGVAICGGFLNTGIEMLSWGDFYASHGIVTVVTWTGSADLPGWRGSLLLGSIAELKELNSGSGNPLAGKMAGRYGTSGYSMGGGGTTMAAAEDTSLKSNVGLAAWSPVGRGIMTPTLLLCGSVDAVASCSQSAGSYESIADTVPKMMVTISASHLNWFGPTDAGLGTSYSGAIALAFQKVFLEGDERWKPTLLSVGGDIVTNIK